MSGERIFVDTNILVYAHEPEPGVKASTATERIDGLWRRREQVVTSTQVLKELYVTLSRKGVPPETLREVVEDYMEWVVVSTTPKLLKHGIDIRERHGISLWDAMIVAAARQGQASQLWTEDLSTSQEYEGIRVVNPLITAEDEPQE